MKNLALIILIFLCTALGGIEVSGNQSGTWTTDNNPYQVVGDITVPSGSSLEIQEGVNVEVMGEYRIAAEGSLIADGTESDPVTFLSPTENQWTGIRLDNDQTDNHFEYCVIQHAENGINIINTQVTISRCHFNNNETGINVFGLGSANPPSVMIDHNLIENCQQNGIMIAESNPYIMENELRQCALDETARAAIQLSCQSTGGVCHPTIEHNHIHNNVWQGITAWDIYDSGFIRPAVYGNLIEENLTGIYLYNASGYFADNVIRNNFVSGNANSGAGVMLYGLTTFPTFTRNIITGNFCGFYIVNSASVILGDLGDGSYENDGYNLIYGNIDESNDTYSIYSTSTQTIKAENCFWDSTDPDEINATIIGNVDYDPLFSTEDTAVSFITGSIPESDGEIIPFLLDAENSEIVSEGKIAIEEGYYLQVPQAGDYYVLLFEQLPEQVGYGFYGGAANPIILSIEEDTILSQINIDEFEYSVPMEIEVLEPFNEGNEDIYPIDIEMLFMYHQQMLVEEMNEGIRIAGFVTYMANEADTLWVDEVAWFVRNDDPQSGDSWVSAEISGGDIVLTEAVVTPCGIGDTLIVDYFMDEEISARRYFVPEQGMIRQKVYDAWALEMDSPMIDHQIVGGNGYMPIHEGNTWTLLDVQPPPYPHSLIYRENEGNIYLLMWEPPAMVVDGWQGYRIYRDGTMVNELEFAEFWENVEVPGGSHEYYVTAFNEAGETLPSNTVTIECESIENDPKPPAPFALDIYPNPMNLSRQDGMSLSIASQIAPTVSLYNVRGQKIRSWKPQKDVSGKYMIRWDGADQSGKTVASGIYFARVQSSRRTLVKKVVLLR